MPLKSQGSAAPHAVNRRKNFSQQWNNQTTPAGPANLLQMVPGSSPSEPAHQTLFGAPDVNPDAFPAPDRCDFPEADPRLAQNFLPARSGTGCCCVVAALPCSFSPPPTPAVPLKAHHDRSSAAVPAFHRCRKPSPSTGDLPVPHSSRDSTARRSPTAGRSNCPFLE